MQQKPNRPPLISAEGKLFGKIDIFVPLLVIMLVIFGIFVTRVITAQQTYVTVQLFASGGEWWWNNPDPPYWLIDPISKGAVEYDPSGNKLVEVQEVKKFEVGERKMLWIKARIRVDTSPKSKQFRFRREPLQVGSLIYVAPNNIKIYSNVMSIEGISKPIEKHVKTVTLKEYSVYPWLADAVKVGTKMVDSDGAVLAEVLEKETVLAEHTTEDWQGGTHATVDPLRRDVTIRVKMQTYYSDGREYFSFFQPLKIGFNLWVPFEELNFGGNVTKIE
jgi:hypothetical protein